MENADFAGKPFPCPVCNMGLRIKISRKQKPYCMCLECGIQIFFRGQEGIRRLYKMIEAEEAVAAEFNGPARAIPLYNRLQDLKRQRDALEEKQGFFSWDSDREKVIEALDAEIERVPWLLLRAADFHKVRTVQIWSTSVHCELGLAARNCSSAIGTRNLWRDGIHAC